MKSSKSPTQEFMAQPKDAASWLAALRAEEGFLSMQEVLPFSGLFIGPAIAARSPANLLRVTHVLTVNGQPPFGSGGGPIGRFTAMPKVQVMAYDDDTSQPILDSLRACIDFIDEARQSRYLHPTGHGGVLVHCTLGMSRSAAVVTAYMMVKGRFRCDEALGMLRRRRRWVRPNDGFLSQLKVLEQLLFPTPQLPLPDASAGLRPETISPREACGVTDSQTPGRVIPAGSTRVHDNNKEEVVAAAEEWGHVEMAAIAGANFVSECSLCKLERTGPWYSYVHPSFVILACSECDDPMLVRRAHGHSATGLSDAELHLALHALSEVASAHYAIGVPWYVDSLQRSVPCHAHAHARSGAPPPWYPRVDALWARTPPTLRHLLAGVGSRGHSRDGRSSSDLPVAVGSRGHGVKGGTGIDADASIPGPKL